MTTSIVFEKVSREISAYYACHNRNLATSRIHHPPGCNARVNPWKPSTSGPSHSEPLNRGDEISTTQPTANTTVVGYQHSHRCCWSRRRRPRCRPDDGDNDATVRCFFMRKNAPWPQTWIIHTSVVLLLMCARAWSASSIWIAFNLSFCRPKLPTKTKPTN